MHFGEANLQKAHDVRIRVLIERLQLVEIFKEDSFILSLVFAFWSGWKITRPTPSAGS